MKKSHKKYPIFLKIFFIVSINLLSIANDIRAQDKYSIRIACVIPSLPGKNVPLVKENNLDNNTVNTNKQQNIENSQETSQANAQLMFQKETSETRPAEQGNAQITVQTIYSR